MIKTFSSTFNERWLFETPIATGASLHDSFPDLVNAIKNNIDNGAIIVNITVYLKKLITDDAVFYWFEKNNHIEIITQLSIKPNKLYVDYTSKNKQISNIHASDFYEMILKDSNQLIFSGEALSDGGIGIWKQLLKHGKKILLYDLNQPLNRKSITTVDELMQYIGNTLDYQNYRFVLSESNKEHVSATTSFDLLRTHNLTFGISEDHKWKGNSRL